MTQTRPFTIAQLSDLHLTHMVGTDASYHQFLACLNLALTHQPDFLLLTGDLVNDGQSSGYDWLFDILMATGIPFACVAGNHDVTIEHGKSLPFDQRTFIATHADTRLMDCTRLDLTNAWQILLLDSTKSGCIDGHFSATQLDWLSSTLAHAQKNTLIACHHPPILVGSAWIDAYMPDNAEAFWHVVQSYPHVVGVLCGHVHQAHHLTHQHAAIFTCPATSRQFLPFSHEFALDECPAGYRLIQLYNTAHLETDIKRLDTIALD